MTGAVPAPSATGVRRALVVVLAAAGVVGASALPSWAAFVDTAAVTTTVATPTVSAPGNVVATASCRGSRTTGTVSWTAGDAPGLSGYRIRAYVGAGWQDYTVGPDTTTLTTGVDRGFFDNNVVTVSVTTLTPYSWTAESARTSRITC